MVSSLYTFLSFILHQKWPKLTLSIIFSFDPFNVLMKSLLYYSLRIPSINISSYHNVFYVSSSSFPKKESGVLSESTVQLLSRWLSLSMGQSSELMFASRIMGIDGAGVTIIYCAGIVSIVFWEQFSTLLSDMDVT